MPAKDNKDWPNISRKLASIMLIFLIEMSKRRAFCLRARSETDSEIKCCHGNRHFPLSMSLFFCVRQTLNIWTKSHLFSCLTETLTERDSFRYHCMFRASLRQLQSGFFTDVKSLNGLFAIQHSRKLVSFCTLWSWKMFKAPIACLSDKKFRKPSNISLEY